MTTGNVITREQSQLMSKAAFDHLLSDDQNRVKEATDKLNRFTRVFMREDGFYRRILPIEQVTEFDRLVSSDDPAIIVDREPGSPAAVSVGFATQPDGYYMRADRYPVYFSRIQSPWWAKDVAQLATWVMDLRTVIGDNSARDLLAEEDGRMLSAVNTAIRGADQVVPTSGVVQHKTIRGGITRDSYYDALKVLPSTPSNLESAKVLLNHITIKDVGKFTHNEFGGTMAQDIMVKGLSETTQLGGQELVVTIKKGLVGNNTMYFFGAPEYLGRFFVYDDATMFVKREGPMLSFYLYETIGATIGNTNAVARVNFA